ncbi:MAG: hypothetical protein O2955_16055, partial [Planctomycetota bacterium]|nr:hypothetical protein [Planctomycetota bacterium]
TFTELAPPDSTAPRRHFEPPSTVLHIRKHRCILNDHADIKWFEKRCAQPNRVCAFQKFLLPLGEGGRRPDEGAFHPE